MSSLMYLHSEFLVVKNGHLYSMLKGEKWILRSDTSFLLATMRMLRHTCCLILIPERYYFDGMSSLMSAFLQQIPFLQSLLNLPLLPHPFQSLFQMMRMMILVIPIYLHHRIPHRFLNGLVFTVEATGSLVGDPSTSCHTQSHIVGSILLIHAICANPKTFVAATRHTKWDSAMEEDYSSLMKNHTWDLCSLPKGRKLVQCKWIYHTKFFDDGSIDEYKAHLVVKGFSQVKGIYYTETFSPVSKMNSIRLVLSLTASQRCPIFQMNLKSAFLHGDLSKDIYMEQPQGFLQDSSLVFKL